MARTMLCENNLSKYFWGEAINTACYILNKVSIRPLFSKTPCELYKERKPNVSHLRSFGCKCCHNGFPLDLDRQKSTQWSRHQSFCIGMIGHQKCSSFYKN